ncbi:short-chain dehydrodenase [Agrilactobacillus composti DSM 18527 = JCM 14202]|nr:SDR family NAD(P)-dependent oxidoreductase [Agrilactobacillus composti]GAF38605.1 short-chain dehydrodenase [Agrilactobacillus composti DSM 18527 = JCM 14202]
MDLNGHHILITGGTTGIGLGLAKAFAAQNNQILIVDDSAEKLAQVKAQLPDVLIYQANLSKADQREDLKYWVADNFADIDMLINDAEIQRWVNLKNLQHDWHWYHQELNLDFEAQIHLTMLFLPRILKQPNGAIVTVSSGLVLNPGAWAPLYTAAKAGVHGFTQALRLQLQDTDTKVFEILPPVVNGDLEDEDARIYGADLDEFIAAVIQQFQENFPEITFDTSWDQLRASKADNKTAAQENWDRFKDNQRFLKA